MYFKYSDLLHHEGDKYAQHDQIKEFRQLTHAFEKAVIAEVQDPGN